MKLQAFKWLSVVGMFVPGILVMLPLTAAAAPHTPHQPASNRPVHQPRGLLPGHAPHRPGPRAAPTPKGSAQCSGVPAACPMPASCRAGSKVSKLFYAYPGRTRSVRSQGFFALNPSSNGIHPVEDGGSISLIDDSGAVILEMQNLQFQENNGQFTASNEQGFVSVGPFAGKYFFKFNFANPDFSPGFFRVRYRFCLNIGDDNISNTIVCQHKPFGGFLCHQ